MFMTGVEIDMIVSDSSEALKLYECIFEVERIEVSDFPKGLNEVIFSIFGTRFHLLDENPGYGMFAPKAGEMKSVWFNIVVPDIATTYKKAMDAACNEIQAVTELPDYGVSSAMFSDPFGYVWMLHQVHRVVSFEERTEIAKKNMQQ